MAGKHLQLAVHAVAADGHKPKAVFTTKSTCGSVQHTACADCIGNVQRATAGGAGCMHGALTTCARVPSHRRAQGSWARASNLTRKKDVAAIIRMPLHISADTMPATAPTTMVQLLDDRMDTNLGSHHTHARISSAGCDIYMLVVEVNTDKRRARYPREEQTAGDEKLCTRQHCQRAGQARIDTKVIHTWARAREAGTLQGTGGK